MDKLQEEFLLLLKSFDRAKILDKFIVIGSWAKEIFMENFQDWETTKIYVRLEEDHETGN